MKKYLFVVVLLSLSCVLAVAQQNALLSNGRLKLVGKQLSNQCGDPVQLRGVSTHAPMAHQNCYNASSVTALASQWGADVLRLAMYTADPGESKGYVNGNREFWDNWIDEMVNLTEANGMYCIIDWHILSDNNPYTNITVARQFFQKMSSRYKNRRHVIYEICNEPNSGVSWSTIKGYANEIIPIIRANDKEGIILVGTPDWCSRPQDAAASPLTGANAYNVMYTVHFYANTHYWHDVVRNAAATIPIFVSEWGSVDASGNGGFNQGNSDTWLNLLNNANGQKISHCNWSFTDKDEAASLLTVGACGGQNWNSRTTAGTYLYNKIRTGDAFSVCQAAGDADGDGVTNGEDLCPGTPANTFVDATGCPALQGDADRDGVIDAKDLCANTPSGTKVNMNGCPIREDFISNVCNGFNNYQNYAKSDFSQATLANFNYWNTPGESTVYSATVSGGQLRIQCTGADPNYAAQGFSFGEDAAGNPIGLDISAHKIAKMDVRFEPSGTYTPADVLFRIQIEDAAGNVINTDPTGLDHRVFVNKNTTRTVSFDFTGGLHLKYEGTTCQPCTLDVFDFTKVTKVIMFCNPGAGATWSRAPFTGLWTIDNFSIGYNEATATTCTAIRDDDGDGVRTEDDDCPETLAGSTVDADGCANYQLDADKDGVSNADDQCPGTPAGAVVNSVGCDASQADDDEDGVKNTSDQCPNTPSSEVANAQGCSPSQLDADGDGVTNSLDLCPNTPAGQAVNTSGCSQAQRDDDNDGTPNGTDGCPNDPNKIAAGTCGCGVADTDSDNDGTPNCNDLCPQDPNKTTPGSCGCGVAEGTCVDCNGTLNGTATLDACNKCVGGTTGVTSDDTDNDGTLNCNDLCPQDPAKIAPGACGCGKSESSCADCNGTPNGTAVIDECNKCVAGTTGLQACTQDCNSVWGGTAAVDNCGVCSGGTTGKVPNATCQTDCNGTASGTAFIDNCGTCVAGLTGLTPCVGILEGEAYCSIDGKVSTDFTGTSGSGYANFDNELGATAVWVVNSMSNQTVNFTFRHTYGATAHRNTEVFVNGISQGIIQFTNTGGWGTWVEVGYELDLLAGSNNISLVSVSTDGGSNIDRISWGRAAVVTGSCDEDCAGTVGGRATIDGCGKCVGGTSGATSDDDDNDGVLNCADQCLNTPANATVDNTGCTVTGISIQDASSVILYPMPTTGSITIEQYALDYTSVRIMTLTGTIVREERLNTTTQEVSMDDLSQGVYIVQLSGTNSSEQFRVIKN